MVKITVLVDFLIRKCIGLSLCGRTLTDHILSTKRDINPLCPRVAQKQHKSIVHFGRKILKMYLKFLVCIASHSIKIIKKVPFLIFTSNFCPISILFGYVHQFFSMLPHSNKKEPVEALCLYFVL